jgi:hypothetical protein
VNRRLLVVLKLGSLAAPRPATGALVSWGRMAKRFQFRLRTLFLWTFIVAGLTVLSKACYDGMSDFFKDHSLAFPIPKSEFNSPSATAPNVAAPSKGSNSSSATQSQQQPSP